MKVSYEGLSDGGDIQALGLGTGLAGRSAVGDPAVVEVGETRSSRLSRVPTVAPSSRRSAILFGLPSSASDGDERVR